jgi:hypothetical protein
VAVGPQLPAPAHAAHFFPPGIVYLHPSFPTAHLTPSAVMSPPETGAEIPPGSIPAPFVSASDRSSTSSPASNPPYQLGYVIPHPQQQGPPRSLFFHTRPGIPPSGVQGQEQVEGQFLKPLLSQAYSTHFDFALAVLQLKRSTGWKLSVIYSDKRKGLHHSCKISCLDSKSCSFSLCFTSSSKLEVEGPSPQYSHPVWFLRRSKSNASHNCRKEKVQHRGRLLTEWEVAFLWGEAHLPSLTRFNPDHHSLQCPRKELLAVLKAFFGRTIDEDDFSPDLCSNARKHYRRHFMYSVGSSDMLKEKERISRALLLKQSAPPLDEFTERLEGLGRKQLWG